MSFPKKYYSEEIIENDILKCLGCKKKYNVPKMLQCGCSICLTCEDNLVLNNDGRLECPICHEDFEKPMNGFPIIKSLQKFILEKTPSSVYREHLHDKTMRKLNHIKLLTINFRDEMNRSESIIKDHCDAQKNMVDLKTESVIETINNQRDQLINKISEYEKDCLLNIKGLDFFQFKEFISDSNKKYENWFKLMTMNTEITDKEIEDIKHEILKCYLDFENQRVILESKVFQKRKLMFSESILKISLEKNNIIGSLRSGSCWSYRINPIDFLSTENESS